MNNADKCWLDKDKLSLKKYKKVFINSDGTSLIVNTLKKEIKYFFDCEITEVYLEDIDLVLELVDDLGLGEEGFKISINEKKTYIQGHSYIGLLYGLYELVRKLHFGDDLNLEIKSSPTNSIRMINHWDNVDGSIERGYSGNSIFFENNTFKNDKTRIFDYARLLASVGINAISINNVNVHKVESYFIKEPFLSDVADIANIFREYGIKLFLSVNFASPLEMKELDTADPLNKEVKQWWEDVSKSIYEKIPDFGGFIVKADSENRPGPFTYNRTHVDGANMLGKALKPYGGLVFWRCFVYNCRQDWRDRSIDRAKAAYDNFISLDGQFNENVILQIKNGPVDFQVREPVSPLFGALKDTNQVLEFQITQEYTGQQKHICYLVPQWKEVLDFDTYSFGKKSTVQNVLKKYPKENNKFNGFTAVANIGLDNNWTGNKLAQSNLYGYGRLTWDSGLTSETIANEWIKLTFNLKEKEHVVLKDILTSSWDTYEKYTAPLGVGWMVNPGHHYGVSVDGYEYDKWGTYHFSNRNGLGVDRTVKSGTGYTNQYYKGNFDKYENLETCPDELILFFHHLPYTYVLKSGKTIIQHIYDTHFEGVETVKKYQKDWDKLKDYVDEVSYNNVKERLEEQCISSEEWRDVINTYYYRKSGIEDKQKRKIYE